MDFSFPIPWPANQPRPTEEAVLQGQPCICSWSAAEIRLLSTTEFHQLRLALEDFGARSARAQGLTAPITDVDRLATTDQRLLVCQPRPGSSTILGGLKVGTKKLFIRRADGGLVEMAPMCVLDFYVHESCQRMGIGRDLMERLLVTEGLTPAQLAYDRPSPKLISFLQRHYGLTSYVPQSNNFVVFDAYFKNPPASHQLQQPRRRRSQQRASSGGGGGEQQQHPLDPHPGCAHEAHHWASVTARPLTDSNTAAPGARDASTVAAAVAAPGAGARHTAAAPAHAFPRGDWQSFPSGACGGTGFGGVSRHPPQLGVSGAPWGAIPGACSSYEGSGTPGTAGWQLKAGSGGAPSSGRRGSQHDGPGAGDMGSGAAPARAGSSGGGSDALHDGVWGGPATPPLGGVRPVHVPLGGGGGSSARPFAQPRGDTAAASDAPHYPYPPYRTAADGALAYGPVTPQSPLRLPRLLPRRPGPKEEYLPAPGGPPTMSTLQVKALRDRGWLPPHNTGASVIATAALAADAAAACASGGALRRSSGGGGGRGGSIAGGLGWWGSAPASPKAAAAAQRSGRAAASCLRYFDD